MLNCFWAVHFAEIVDRVGEVCVEFVLRDEKGAPLLRDEIIESRIAPRVIAEVNIQKQHESIAVFLWYASNHPSRKRRVSMDVDKMVDLWVDLIPRFSLGHDKNELDRAEGLLDDSFAPFLTCPIKELREFFGKLVERLKNEPKVPYVVWRTYEQWYEKIIKPAQDQEIKLLKEDMAKKIIGLIDTDTPEIKQDFRDAMIDALMWRSEEQLKDVEEALESGKGKPRVRGRQSCLYLQVYKDDQKELVAEVML